MPAWNYPKEHFGFHFRSRVLDLYTECSTSICLTSRSFDVGIVLIKPWIRMQQIRTDMNLTVENNETHAVNLGTIFQYSVV